MIRIAAFLPAFPNIKICKDHRVGSISSDGDTDAKQLKERGGWFSLLARRGHLSKTLPSFKIHLWHPQNALSTRLMVIQIGQSMLLYVHHCKILSHVGGTQKVRMS